MNNNEGILYINELETISYDRTEQQGEFIYDYGNGEEKELKGRNIIKLGNLFSDDMK